MRILFDHSSPFLLAHGGVQVQIEQTKLALERAGIEVEHLRWWDEQQRGDLIHYFGAPPVSYVRQVKVKGIPLVITNLFTATCNRSEFTLRAQGWLVRLMLRLPFGEGIKKQLAWQSFAACDRMIVGLDAERRVLELVYRVASNRISVVPLGLSKTFLEAGYGTRSGDYLVCVGTITDRKNCVPLAELAKKAQTPILFVGKPYSENDPYWISFRSLVDGHYVRYAQHIDDSVEVIGIVQGARGAVIMSRYENWCLSAHEAAACGLPLLLPPKKWAYERFGNQAYYFAGQPTRDAAILREFYHRCPSLSAPKIRLYDWGEVAKQLCNIYQNCLHAPR